MAAIRSTRLGGIILGIGAAIAAIVPGAASAFTVTSAAISIAPSTHTGPCPAAFRLTIQLTADGPGTATWALWFGEGAAAPTATAPRTTVFKAAETKTIEESWNSNPPGGIPPRTDVDGWIQVRVSSPNARKSKKASFSVHCRAALMVAPGGVRGIPGLALKPNLIAVLNHPMDANVTVKNLGPGPAGASFVVVSCKALQGGVRVAGGKARCPDLPNPGGKPIDFTEPAGYGLGIPALAAGASSTAVLSPAWGSIAWPPGVYAFTAVADATHLVDETNEGDNTATSMLNR